MNYDHLLSNRAKNTNTSAIRELLKASKIPGIISMAGGLPAPESFPTEVIQHLANTVIEKYGAGIFQYGITEGLEELREGVVELLKKRDIDTNINLVGISTGAQTAIDAAAKILIDKGDKVAIESPTFLAAIKTFRMNEPELIAIETDEEGLIPEKYEAVLKKNELKMLYIIPNFQNPTGRTLSLARRKKIAALAIKYKTIIVEDDPYFELRYEGEHLPAIKSFAPENTIYIGSLSKVLSPGLRLGYYNAPERLQELMTSVRQGVDVHANSLSQAIAAEYIKRGYLDSQLRNTLSIYSQRLTTMLDELEANLTESFNWSKPKGGMFIWVEGPKNFNANELYKQALENKIAFVPGQPFFAEPNVGKNTFRLNFTNVITDDIERAIRILGKLVKDIRD